MKSHKLYYKEKILTGTRYLPSLGMLIFCHFTPSSFFLGLKMQTTTNRFDMRAMESFRLIWVTSSIRLHNRPLS